MSLLDKVLGHNADKPAGQPHTDQRFEELKQKYSSVLRLMEQQQVRLMNLHVQDNKLYIRGAAPSAEVKNRIWDQIKLVDPTYSDLMAELEAQPGAAAPSTGSGATSTSAGTAAGGERYTVQAGDTLSKIAKQYYGDANQYMRIFEANRDQLKDPNRIAPGQVLTIPPR